jgi:hypothetical protein
MKSFHGVLAGNVHECSLKSRIGRVRNTDLTRRLLMTSTTEARRVASLLTKDDIETLSEINKLRVLLHHHREQFSKDEQALINNSKAMLIAIRKATATALFQIVARLQG